MTRAATRRLHRPAPEPPARVSLSDLRRLVVGPETVRLDQLESNLGNPELQAEAVARVLPRAVSLRALGDRELQVASEPIVAQALRETVRKDPEMLADALFPIVGRAVRKAVAAAFAAIMERVSAAMEHTFTVKGLRWRLEAARTGRPLAEVVLSHSLLFRVEHVFLLHRPTGLLLASASAASEVADPEMVAAMFSVIEGFVRETFADREPLTQFAVGELTGRIEHGPSTILVALVRGTPPVRLTGELRDAVERIELQWRDALTAFRGGDTKMFEATRPILEGTLLCEQRRRPRSNMGRIALAAVGAVLAAFVIAWITLSLERGRRLHAYADAFATEPGIVVTGAEREGGRPILTGLRDPLAREPSAVLVAHGLDPTRATLRFQPFYSPDVRLLERRLRAALSPPAGVVLSVDGGNVSASGVAPREWLQRARLAGELLPGVTSLDVHAVHEKEAIAAVEAAIPDLERATFSFQTGSIELDPTDAPRLDALAGALKKLAVDASRAGEGVQVVLEGHTDRAGGESINRSLSQARADVVAAELIRRGVPRDLLDARGGGAVAEEAGGDRGRHVRPKVKVTP